MEIEEASEKVYRMTRKSCDKVYFGVRINIGKKLSKMKKRDLQEAGCRQLKLTYKFQQ